MIIRNRGFKTRFGDALYRATINERKKKIFVRFKAKNGHKRSWSGNGQEW